MLRKVFNWQLGSHLANQVPVLNKGCIIIEVIISKT